VAGAIGIRKMQHDQSAALIAQRALGRRDNLIAALAAKVSLLNAKMRRHLMGYTTKQRRHRSEKSRGRQRVIGEQARQGVELAARPRDVEALTLQPVPLRRRPREQRRHRTGRDTG
jgi:hypothetical protein